MVLLRVMVMIGTEREIMGCRGKMGAWRESRVMMMVMMGTRQVVRRRGERWRYTCSDEG